MYKDNLRLQFACILRSGWTQTQAIEIFRFQDESTTSSRYFYPQKIDTPESFIILFFFSLEKIALFSDYIEGR